jgi:hypothetical protein
VPDLPPIRQKVIVDVEGDRAAAQKIGATSASLDDLTEAQDRNAKSSRVLTDEQRKLLDARIQAGRQQRGFIRQHQLEKAEVDKTAKAHGLLGRALDRNNDEHRKATSELKKITAGFKTAGAAASLFALFIGLIKWPAMAAGAGLATSALSALAAGAVALVGTLGPLLNLVGLLPAALAAAAGGIGAALLGTRGVGEAIGAGFAKPTGRGATKDPVDEARKQEDAIRGVARAQEALSDSQRDVTRAQEDLNKAWLEARNNLRDLREEQTRGTNSVARAEIALTRARERQQELAEDGEATAIDQREALLDISDAELDLLDAQQRRTQNARDLAEAESKGVAGSDAVTDATERLSDSQQTVIDNTLELKRAIEDVGRSMKDSGSGEVNKFAEAMAELGPEAREFVNTIVGQKSAFKNIKRDVSEALFGPINDGMKTLLGNAPAFTAFLTASATGVGNLAKSLLDAFGDKGIGEDFARLGEGNKALFDSLAAGIKPLVKIFTDLAVVGQPFVKEILDLAVGGLTKFSDKIGEMRASGGLADFFRRGLDTAKEFGRILRDLFVGLSNIFKAAKPLGDDLLDSFGNLIKRFRDFTASFTGQTQMQTFFANQKPVLEEVGGLLLDIGSMWFRLANANAGPLRDVIARLRTEGLPIIEKLVTSVGPKFVNNILDLAFALGNLFSTLFGETGPMSVFLDVMTKVFTAITNLLNTVPLLKEFVFLVAALGAAFKAINLVGAITGINGFIGLLRNKTLQTFLFGKAESWGAAAVPGLFGRIGAAAGAAGGGVTGLVTALGPYALAVGAAVGVGFALIKGWEQMHQRGNDLKRTVKDMREAFKDANKTIEESIELATQKRIADKHQDDDLKRVGVTTKDIATAALEGGQKIEDLRRKLVESGEVSFDSIIGDNAALVQKAVDTYIRTGEFIKGVTVENAGLALSLEDVAEAADKAAQEQIDMGRATGDITPVMEGQAILWDIQNQGILDFLGNGRRYAAELDHIRTAQEKVNRGLEDAIELQKERARGITGVAGARISRDESGRNAIKAAGDLAAAEKKLADLQAAGKGDTEEGRTAQLELTEARDDANRAALDYADSNLRLAEAEAEMRGETLTTNQVVDAQRDALKGVAAFVDPSSAFRADIDSLVGDFDALFTDRELTVNVHTSPEIGAWLDGLRDAIGNAVNAGFKGGLLGVVGLPSEIGKAAAKTPVPPATAIITTKRAFKEVTQAASGGVLSAIGSGFRTDGPLAIVGEGKPMFPEYVIPTDPQYRNNSYLLLMDLLGKLGPTYAGGGTLGDFSGLRLQAGALDMGTTRTITQGDTITGDHIGTSIGNEWRFEEGAIQVKDWDAAKEQLARDERLRNMTRSRGARSR